MKLSAQEEYGLRCLIAIASQESGTMTIPEISEREGITQPHAAKTLALLKEKGFITANRGQKGGYSLSNPAARILISDVLCAIGGKLFDGEFCDRFGSEHEACVHFGNCSLQGLYTKVQKAVDAVLEGVTLADLIPQTKVPMGSLTDRGAAVNV